MQTQPFSVMLDASNDKGVEKTFPITVHIFNEYFDQIVTQFFDMNLLHGRDGSTAEVMFNSVVNQLEKHEIMWDYGAALGVDDTNVNIGDHDSIKSKLREKNIVEVPLTHPTQCCGKSWSGIRKKQQVRCFRPLYRFILLVRYFQ